MHSLDDYQSTSGTLEPVWTIEVQTIAQDVDPILDAVIDVYPLAYGKYMRNAFVSAVGFETSQPGADTTTSTHKPGFQVGQTESYPFVVLTISVPRDNQILDAVMTQILDQHIYEQPVIYVREAWASRANYSVDNDNPNRWWNRLPGKGLPDPI